MRKTVDCDRLGQPAAGLSRHVPSGDGRAHELPSRPRDAPTDPYERRFVYRPTKTPPRRSLRGHRDCPATFFAAEGLRAFCKHFPKSLLDDRLKLATLRG